MSETSSLLLYWYDKESNWSIQTMRSINWPRRNYADYSEGEKVLAKYNGQGPFKAIIIKIADSKNELRDASHHLDGFIKQGLPPQVIVSTMGFRTDIGEVGGVDHDKSSEVLNVSEEVGGVDHDKSSEVLNVSEGASKTQATKKTLTVARKSKGAAKNTAATGKRPATVVSTSEINQVAAQKKAKEEIWGKLMSMQTSGTELDDDEHEESLEIISDENVPRNAKGHPSVAIKVPRSTCCQGCIGKTRAIQALETKIIEQDKTITTLRSSDAYDSVARPRQGLVPLSLATKHKMEELIRGSGVFLYPEDIAHARNKGRISALSPRSKSAQLPGLNGGSMARVLLNKFFTREALLRGSICKDRKDKEELSPPIIEAIIGFVLGNSNWGRAKIRDVIFSALSSTQSKARVKTTEPAAES